MKLNHLETLLVNNPARTWHQRVIECRLLKGLLPESFEPENVLIAGCGRGIEVELAFERFGARSVRGFDLDPLQLRRARRRVGKKYEGRVSLWLGDASAMAARSGRYDLVLDWGVFHHVPNWQLAVAETARLLAPGGYFLFFEVPAHKILAPHYKVLFDHPLENRFEAEDFQQVCEANDLLIAHSPKTYFSFFYGAASRPL